MANPVPPSKNLKEFSDASADPKAKRKPKPLSNRMKMIIGGGVTALFIGGYMYSVYSFVPPQGNILYGICRVFIERQLQFPNTMRIVEFSQKIPESEDQRYPKRVTYGVTFSSTDGFGQRMLNTVDCDFRYDDALANGPSLGYTLERTLVNGRAAHGWSDVYYPPNRKKPRAADDNSELLEEFNKIIPVIIAHPPDLTLPMRRLRYMKIEDLQNIN